MIPGTAQAGGQLVAGVHSAWGTPGYSCSPATPSMAKVRVQLVARRQEHIGHESQGAIPPTTSGSGRRSGQSGLLCLAQQVFSMRIYQVSGDAGISRPEPKHMACSPNL
jgi:hypothetical protein